MDDRVALSPRQAAVARMTAQGFTQGEIAAELGISRRTVEAHAAALRSKTGMTTTRKAAGAARGSA